MVIWLTGLSGAGKTTLCTELVTRLKPRLPQLVVLDGDAIRASISGDLGYTEADRVIQIGRVQRLARMLSTQDLVVLVAVVYANPELLAWNRQHIPDYFEVYLRAPLATVTTRDAKGIYGRAARGETSNVVGVDIPWHEPVAPDLVLDTDGRRPVSDLADDVIAAVPSIRDAVKA